MRLPEDIPAHRWIIAFWIVVCRADVNAAGVAGCAVVRVNVKIENVDIELRGRDDRFPEGFYLTVLCKVGRAPGTRVAGKGVEPCLRAGIIVRTVVLSLNQDARVTSNDRVGSENDLVATTHPSIGGSKCRTAKTASHGVSIGAVFLTCNFGLHRNRLAEEIGLA